MKIFDLEFYELILHEDKNHKSKTAKEIINPVFVCVFWI